MEIFQIMIQSNRINEITDEFIDIKIERAFSGISYIKVQNNGNFFARLERRSDGFNFVYQNGFGLWKSKRSLKAMKTIFHRLINIHQSFEVDDIIYIYGRGSWRWHNIKD